MRLLMIHSNPFSFEITDKTKFAEEIVPPVVDRAEVDNALVVFAAVEQHDAVEQEKVCGKAFAEIKKTYENVGASIIALYPYSHLSNRLAPPEVSLRLLKNLRGLLEDMPLVQCPFGWYKKFSLNGIGHPVSESSRVIEIDGRPREQKVMGRGREHPVAAMNQQFREVFLELGLDEMINPAIIDDFHIYKQYGPEAPLILDRVFYIAGLDRADIGLGKSKLAIINKIVPGFDKEEQLQALMREYKEALIEADDFLEEFALRLKISGEQAGEILEKAFPEFRELTPVPMTRTLRSHMTSNWFPVLQRMRTRSTLPVKLFSVGSRFRREQRQDAQHLYESTSASIVVMDNNVTMEDGKKLSYDILKKMGFKRCKFVKKKVASRYYDPETDTEIFVNYKGAQIEVGNLGFYAPESLKNYDIDVPVFNIGFGVERMAMILGGGTDIRALVYPQFYEEVSFTDEELAGMLTPSEKPKSEELLKAVAAMAELARKSKDITGPAEVDLFCGDIQGEKVTITLFNWDAGKPLLSKAAENEIVVYENGIYGLPPKADALGGKFVKIYNNGVKTGLLFIDMMICGFAARVEKAIDAGETGQLEEKWKVAKRPQQVNLEIPEAGYDYVQGLHKPIKVGGPLFCGLRAKW